MGCVLEVNEYLDKKREVSKDEAGKFPSGIASPQGTTN
jgi:hypothetical protein